MFTNHGTKHPSSFVQCSRSISQTHRPKGPLHRHNSPSCRQHSRGYMSNHPFSQLHSSCPTRNNTWSPHQSVRSLTARYERNLRAAVFKSSETPPGSFATINAGLNRHVVRRGRRTGKSATASALRVAIRSYVSIVDAQSPEWGRRAL